MANKPIEPKNPLIEQTIGTVMHFVSNEGAKPHLEKMIRSMLKYQYRVAWDAAGAELLRIQTKGL